MTIPALSSVTGAAVSGLTSPTYTVAADSPPDTNQKQFFVSALGGTQTGVLAHSIAAPFLINFQRPKSFRGLGKINSVTGLLTAVPKNKHVVRTVKGVLPLAGQPYELLIIRTEIEVPAGSDIADANSIRAALAAHAGTLATASVAAGLSDTLINGAL
jgi:hypothetical protein